MSEQDSVHHLLNEWRRERPDLDPSPVGIQGRIIRLSAHLFRRIEQFLAPMNLGWEAFSLLVTLRRSGRPYEMRPTDILSESLLTSGAITNRIDRVEQMGLVERHPDARDRRSFMIRLTPAGKKLADKAIALHFAAIDDLLQVLTTDERQQMASLLAKLLAAFEQNTARAASLRANADGSPRGRTRQGNSSQLRVPKT
jgi:DNA-binding MarR family transcriptional regulator